MSSVAEILQSLADSAGRAQLQRGAILGNTIANVAQVPAQYYADKEHDQQLAIQRDAEAQKLGFARNADTRAQSDQDMQERAAQLATAKGQALKVGIAAGFGDSSDPKDFDESKAIKAVTDAGFPELAQTISETHRSLLPKLTSGAPGSVMRDEAGQIVSGSEIPEKKPDYTINGQRFSGNDAAPIGGVVPPQATKAIESKAVMLDGKPALVNYNPANGTHTLPDGTDVSSRVKPVPPASIQINNAAAATANQPASAAEKAIANYMLPPISPRSMQTPAGKAMMDRILTENPDYRAEMYSVRAPTKKAYTTGTQGQQITAMNTAIEHLDQLQAAADALKSGEFKPGNAVYNKIAETFGGNAPTNYDAIKNLVDKEVEAVANKGVPTVSGTAEQKALAGKNASPEQIKGYIDTLIPLMGSKLNALDYAYKQAMGENDPYKPLTPQAESILEKRGFNKDATKATSAASASVPTNVATALKGAAVGKHTLSDGSVWVVGPDGSVTKGS